MEQKKLNIYDFSHLDINYFNYLTHKNQEEIICGRFQEWINRPKAEKPATKVKKLIKYFK